MSELLLGCGFARAKLLALPGEPHEWRDLVTLDTNPRCEPDILCDLDSAYMMADGSAQWWVTLANEHGARFLDFFTATDKTTHTVFRENSFDEVHAYEVLEHLGRQGDVSSFFCTFYNIHRILRPGGHLFATVPSRYSSWLWGDPSHRRVICAESLAFLSQEVIAKNRAQGTAMSDFSALWTRDFKVKSMQDNHTSFIFCLEAVK